MKNIKYLFISLSFLAFFACDDSDDGAIALTDVAVEATIAADKDLVEETDDVGYSVSINQTFSSDADMRVNVRFNDDRQFSTTLTIPAGETSASGVLLFRSDDGTPIDPFQNGGVLTDFVTLKVTGIVLSEPTVGDNYVISSNEVLLDLIDGTPSALGEPGLSITFTWESGDDYDLFYNGNLGLNAGATGNNPEALTLTDAQISDGDSQLVYNPFSKTSTGDITYRVVIKVTNADETVDLMSFSGSLDAANSAATSIYPLVNINKTTDGAGVATYVLTALED